MKKIHMTALTRQHIQCSQPCFEWMKRASWPCPSELQPLSSMGCTMVQIKKRKATLNHTTSLVSLHFCFVYVMANLQLNWLAVACLSLNRRSRCILAIIRKNVMTLFQDWENGVGYMLRAFEMHLAALQYGSARAQSHGSLSYSAGFL